MSDEPTNRELLEAIQGVEGRLDRVEGKLGKVEGKLDKLDCYVRGHVTTAIKSNRKAIKANKEAIETLADGVAKAINIFQDHKH